MQSYIKLCGCSVAQVLFNHAKSGAFTPKCTIFSHYGLTITTRWLLLCIHNMTHKREYPPET